jgi:hypothetical protein
MEVRPHTRTPGTDEVLWRVGRNVVQFQYVENLLKRLMAQCLPAGPASKIKAQAEKHVEALNISTMGVLAGKLMETVLKSPAEKSVHADNDEIWTSFRFSVGADTEFCGSP